MCLYYERHLIHTSVQQTLTLQQNYETQTPSSGDTCYQQKRKH